jgi:type I restriction enzyme S subunit
MSFPAYSEYKESGDEWLGKVPEHWQALALSRVLAAPVTDGPHTTPEFLDDGVPFLSVDGIQDGKLYFEGCRYVSFEDHKEFSKKAAPKYNDLLMGKAASIGKIARVTENIEFSIWSPLALIRVNKGQCSPEFLEFCLKSSELQHQVLLASNSNTQLNIGMKDIPKLRIPLPAVQEQTQIARFLDHETARIDALIEEQQRLIELLKEKRQAVISHAVTKGLDPTVPMKDSGVEWLGEVPAHWAVSPLKFLVEEKVAGPYGASLTKAMYTYSGYRVYGQQQVISDDFSIGDYYISEEKFSEMQRYVVFPGDVLVSVMGTIGRVSVVPVGVEVGIINPRLVRYKFASSKMVPEFVKILLMSLRYQSRLREESQGSTMEGLNMVILGALPLVSPPLDTQYSIVAFVKNYDSNFNELVSQATSAVDLLQERRSALISVAVTGKIDVRGWQPLTRAQAPESLEVEAV